MKNRFLFIFMLFDHTFIINRRLWRRITVAMSHIFTPFLSGSLLLLDFCSTLSSLEIAFFVLFLHCTMHNLRWLCVWRRSARRVNIVLSTAMAHCCSAMMMMMLGEAMAMAQRQTLFLFKTRSFISHFSHSQIPFSHTFSSAVAQRNFVSSLVSRFLFISSFVGK